MSNPQHTNRFARETSPYLLQHAHNPVNWFSWGPQAFERARRLNKPTWIQLDEPFYYKKDDFKGKWRTAREKLPLDLTAAILDCAGRSALLSGIDREACTELANQIVA